MSRLSVVDTMLLCSVCVLLVPQYSQPSLSTKASIAPLLYRHLAFSVDCNNIAVYYNHLDHIHAYKAEAVCHII